MSQNVLPATSKSSVAPPSVVAPKDEDHLMPSTTTRSLLSTDKQLNDETPKVLIDKGVLDSCKHETSTTRSLLSDKEQLNDETQKLQIDNGVLDSSKHDNDSASLTNTDTEEEYSTLSEDIYSLFYTTRTSSHAFSFAIFVFLFQVIVICLIMIDLIDTKSENPLKIPATVPLEVTIAQAFAVILAVATQGDLFSAVIAFHDGYDPRVKEVDPECIFSKWLFACLGQFLVGCGLLVVIFILIIQSTTVIGLMLNFAALSFVSEIDNVAFKLGKYGFCSDYVQAECNDVASHKFPPQSRKESNILRRVVFLLIIASLLGGWGYVVHLQRWGAFIPSSIYVQFGDALNPFLGLFSGVYDYDKENYINRRLVYVERRSGEAYFAYCAEEQAWSFSTLSSFGPCGERNATSRDVTSDITESTSDWHVQYIDNSGDPMSRPFDYFVMTSSDCRSENYCHNLGQCQNNRCVCNDGRYGRQCEFGAPCPKLSVDERTVSFPDDEVGLTQLSTEFLLLLNEDDEPVLVYDKPVYVFDYGSGIIDIIMFLGRRWVSTNSITLDRNATNITSTNDLAEYLADDFHGYFDSFASYFVSAPMNVDTPSDAASPVGLQWFRVKQSSSNSQRASEADESQPLDTNLLCTACVTGTNECLNLGECVESSCVCLDGFFGDLCEESLPCVEFGCYANGTCNEVTGVCACNEGFAGNLCEIEVQ